MFVGHVVYQVN